ncbi:peptidoglycan editing factor PgeF [bacterium]|nr:peptidoglycan editing factor PgeF [bacterium]
MAFEVVREGEVALIRCTALESRHAFSTRQGGTSEAPYASLNLGLSSGDERSRVLANRERFVSAGGFSGPIQVAHQVHGADVHAAPVPEGAKGDVVITDRPATPVGVFVADCVPILIEDARTGAVAAVHAGWRGTAKGAVTAAVEALAERYGAQPADLRAAIGPSIKGCCYRVGEEVVEALGHLSAPERVVRREGEAAFVDLQEANRQLLAAAGVGAIHVSGLCTHCSTDLFFSYRREGERSGRMLAAIERA